MKRIFSILCAASATVFTSFTAAQDVAPLPGGVPVPPTRVGPANQAPSLTTTTPGVPATTQGYPGTLPNNMSGQNTIPRGRFYQPVDNRNSQRPDNPLFGSNQNTTVSGLIASPNSRAASQANRKIRQLMVQVRDATDSGAESKATDELKKTLDELFDEKINEREKEIEAIEKRLKELQKRNDERKQKKSEIVDLKLKSLVNEAKGFGF